MLGLLTACESGLGPRNFPAPPSALATLECNADVVAGRVGCGPTAGSAPSSNGVARDLVLGKQGIYVTLATSGATYTSATQQFTFTMTVTNLLAQPIGTPDGTAISKIRVFINGLPTVNAGTGTVAVVPDSIGSFISSSQPYYIYNTKLATNQVSAGRTWTFVIPPTVRGFRFQVYVDAAAPAEGSVLLVNALRQSGLSGQSFNAISRLAGGGMYVAGNAGATLRYSGTAWSLLNSGSVANLLGVYAASDTSVWAVGPSGTRIHWTGTAWVAATVPTVGASLNAIWGRARDDIYAVGDTTKLLHFDGSSWSIMTPPAGVTANLKGVWGTSDGSTVYAVGNGGVILRYTVAGATWATMTSPVASNLLAAWGTSASDVYSVGVSGRIVHYNGTAWTLMTSPVSGQLNAISGAAANDIYAVGNSATVAHWNGIAWSAVTAVPFSTTLFGVAATGANGLWAVGQGGTIFRYDGVTWTLDDASGPQILGVWASGTSDVWATTSVGIMLHYAGVSWAMSPTVATYFALWGSSAAKILAAGPAGNYAVYNGTTWTAGSVGGSAPTFRGVWGSAANSIYAVGDGGAVYLYNGTTLSSQFQAASTGTLNSVWGSGSNNVFAAAANGDIIRFTGLLWGKITSGSTATLNGVYGSSSSDVWVVGNGSSSAATVLHYDGSFLGSFTTVTSGAPANLRSVWAAAAGDVYAVGDGGLIWHYNGTGWIGFTSGTTQTLRSVFGLNATQLYIGGDLGTILTGTR